VIRNRRLRRGVAGVLVVAGALLMLLSPSVTLGLLPFTLGVVLELLGLAIERRDPR
jgi:uncharacterized membrane protein HdeD (DUF308 family)